MSLRKLTDDQVREIRKLASTHNLTDLARKYHVSDVVINNVIHYRTYKNVDPVFYGKDKKNR